MDLSQITKPTPIGEVTEDIISLLNYGHNAGKIMIGPSNVTHMQHEHPSDYVKYSPYLQDILDSPDYVGVNPHDGSIQYIKEFPPDQVLVGVRISGSEVYFSRSLYVISPTKFKNYLNANRLVPVPKP